MEEIIDVDYKELYTRLLADYQNLQKRSSNEVLSAVDAAKNKLLLEILPLYHDVKLGTTYKEAGAKLVYDKFIKFLESKNIGIINNAFFKERNNAFDDNYANAVGITMTNNKELNNTIHGVVEDGFIDNSTGKVISFAKVFVFKYGE